MKMICIRNVYETHNLTLGKEYDCSSASGNELDRYKVVNDRGSTRLFNKDRFISVADFKHAGGGAFYLVCVNNTELNGVMTIGDVYKCYEQKGHKEIIKTVNNHGVQATLYRKRFLTIEEYNSRKPAFNTEILMEKNPKEEDTSMKKGWSFNVQSYKDISLTEIQKDLTRTNPVAIVSASKGEYVYLLIHASVINKAKVLGENEYMSTTIRCSHSKIGKVIAWVKKIKSMPWGKHQNKDVITVTFPTI